MAQAMTSAARAGEAPSRTTAIVGVHASLDREVGIPAVVGTGDATARLRDGQMVTVDGAAGLVEVAETG